jgi:hypothetical protein
MTFDIEINGHARTISIERAATDQYRVIVDGRPQLIDATRVGSFGLSLLFDGADRSSREVQVLPGGSSSMAAAVDRQVPTAVSTHAVSRPWLRQCPGAWSGCLSPVVMK